MPRVSKARLYEQRLGEIEQHFSQLVSSLTTHSAIEGFFSDFLTREEKIMLTKRLVLYMMVKRGYSPSSIQAALHVSYETVRTYNNLLASKNAIFHKIIDDLIEKEKSKEFWRKVDKALRPIELALQAKTNMKARAKLASGDWS